jgi:hypothetical protein
MRPTGSVAAPSTARHDSSPDASSCIAGAVITCVTSLFREGTGSTTVSERAPRRLHVLHRRPRRPRGRLKRRHLPHHRLARRIVDQRRFARHRMRRAHVHRQRTDVRHERARQRRHLHLRDRPPPLGRRSRHREQRPHRAPQRAFLSADAKRSTSTVRRRRSRCKACSIASQTVASTSPRSDLNRPAQLCLAELPEGAPHLLHCVGYEHLHGQHPEREHVRAHSERPRVVTQLRRPRVEPRLLLAQPPHRARQSRQREVLQ